MIRPGRLKSSPPYDGIAILGIYPEKAQINQQIAQTSLSLSIVTMMPLMVLGVIYEHLTEMEILKPGAKMCQH